RTRGRRAAGRCCCVRLALGPYRKVRSERDRARAVAALQQPLYVATCQAFPTGPAVVSALRSGSLGSVVTRIVNSWRESSTRGGQNAHDARTRKPHRLAESSRCRVGSRGL